MATTHFLSLSLIQAGLLTVACFYLPPSFFINEIEILLLYLRELCIIDIDLATCFYKLRF